VDNLLRFKKAFLIVGDATVFYLSLLITLFIRHPETFSQNIIKEHLGPFSLILILWLLIFYIIGLYDFKNLKNSLQFLKILGVSFLINLLIATAIFYIFPFGISPKRNLLLLALIFNLFIIFWRWIFNSLASRQAPQKTVIIGDSPLIQKIINELHQNPLWGYEIVGWLKKGVDDPQLKDLPFMITNQKITTLIIPFSLKENQNLVKILYQNLVLGIEILELTDFFEQIFKKTPLVELEKHWFLENLAKSRRLYETVKRPIEIFLALIILLITLPLFLIIGFLIKITSSGPIIYKQTRIGQLEKPFILYKFRTMKKDAEKNGPQWAIKNDPRITFIGKILRASHLDELPQIFNILKGELSFVGPRPERPEFVKELKEKIPYYEIRHLVKPGLTGWAQINYRYGASIEDAYEKLEYDIYYLKNRSLTLDLLIILKTIKAFFFNPR